MANGFFINHRALHQYLVLLSGASGGAHEYYRNVLKVMLNELARVDCEIKEVRRPSVYLSKCNFEIKWE